ncbi:MAG: hypothetical protein AAGA99_13130 [Actinomycetota bacterium]
MTVRDDTAQSAIDPALDARSTRVEANLRVLGFGLLGLAAGLIVNSMVGPLVADLVDYPVSETMRNQTIGLAAGGIAAATALIARAPIHGRRTGIILIVLYAAVQTTTMIGAS